jgi:uncharacterized protein YdeI (YjbR/CyaY-like superfamily)
LETSADLRAWLEANHDSAAELWVGIYKKATGRPSITWPELVDELLCFGWIDGLRKSIDEERWMIRVTPRRPRSNWSEVNQRRFAELRTEGRVAQAGLAAFGRWRQDITTAAAGPAVDELSPELASRLEGNEAARAYLEAESQSYRSSVIRWVMGAKREETRLRRLERLIDDSAAGLRIREMRR